MMKKLCEKCQTPFHVLRENKKRRFCSMDCQLTHRYGRLSERREKVWEKCHYLNLAPLRDNGWQYEFKGNYQFGRWIDPLTRQKYGTEEALKIQDKRCKSVK